MLLSNNNIRTSINDPSEVTMQHLLGLLRRHQGRFVFGLGVVLAAILLLVGLVGTSTSGQKQTAYTPTNPAIGTQDNTNPVMNSSSDSWRALVNTVNNGGNKYSWYKACLQTQTGITWSAAEQYASLNDKGWDLRFIVVSNSSITDDQARSELKAQGYQDVDNMAIVRLAAGQLDNTRSVPGNNCQGFTDNRSQVRVTLGVPQDVKDPSKGMRDDKGVLSPCNNPWKKQTPPAPKPTTPAPTPTHPVCIMHVTSTCTHPTPPACKTGCVTTPPPGCSHCHPTTPPPCSTCVDKTKVQIPVRESGQPTKANPGPYVPSSPPASHSPVPVNTDHPASPTPGGYNGGSTSNPVVSGSPTPVDTQTHSSPVPTPTCGPFAGTQC